MQYPALAGTIRDVFDDNTRHTSVLPKISPLVGLGTIFRPQRASSVTEECLARWRREQNSAIRVQDGVQSVSSSGRRCASGRKQTSIIASGKAALHARLALRPPVPMDPPEEREKRV